MGGTLAAHQPACRQFGQPMEQGVVRRAQDPLVVVEVVTEVREAALPHRPKRAEQSTGSPS